MSKLLQQLSLDKKKAIIALSCAVIATRNKGHLNLKDPDLDMVLKECFDEEWVNNREDSYRGFLLYESLQSKMEEHMRKVAALEIEEKYAFKTMILAMLRDNAIEVLTAGYIFKQIGLPENSTSQKETKSREEKNTQEEDGTFVVENSYYARLTDVGAVRGDSNDVFTVVDDASDEGIKVGTNYDAWEKAGVCPVNGVIGYVMEDQNKKTSEGTLCYLMCEDNLIVPVMEWGLERIDEWEYREKRQNNRILSFDKSGHLCAALRKMPKKHQPSIQKNQKDVSEDKKVVHFMATVQQRFEPGKFFPANYTERQIHLTYTKRGSLLELEVLGVMKPRHAKFENDNGRILRYRDTTNEDVYYEVETEPVHNSIVRVSIFQPINEYYEFVEYRYTIDYSND